MFYGQFALKAQETRQKLYDEIRALEIQKSKLSKAPSVSSVPTPPPTPSHAAVEESDDDDEKALGSLGGQD